jgi:hypothetical protein
MTIRVLYRKGTWDYVHTRTLDKLIDQNLIKKFYRPSEERWVDVNTDPVRRGIRLSDADEGKWLSLSMLAAQQSVYAGVERRATA